MRVLDLFSGIGGFSLGLERTGGFRTVAFCEIDPYCRRVLAKHWPGVPIYHDIRRLDADRLAADGILPDVLCGGFPCQDISVAGAGAGIDGARSGLWREYARLVGEIRPRYVLVENVAALLGRGLGDVLGSLAALGYDAEWHCIPASAVGAPHRRDRVWIVADADGERRGQAGRDAARDPSADSGWAGDRLGDASPALAHANGARLAIRQGIARDDGPKLTAIERSDWWLVEPDVGRVAYGVPARVDRLRGLGNAVVPQIPELIGRAILASMREAAA
jgi:DNA (cytosine-5)-methyltransferase 1